MLQVNSDLFDQDTCTMHDLLRSLAHSLSKDQSFYCDPKKLLITDISKFRHLSIVGVDEAITIPTPNNKKLRLRTLLLESPPNVIFHMFERLQSLRILQLNEEGIDTIPESLKELKFLRLLDLDRTRIKKIPECIGFLVNLEILNLQGCECLESLPKGLTKLCNLRRLGLRGTPLKSVPKGIGGLKLLNDLEGFIVASNSFEEQENDDWDLKKLEPLTNLRYLHIEGSQVCDVQVFEGKSHMIKLEMYCTPLDARDNEKAFSEVELCNVENFFQNMSPPLCLKELHMGFSGREYPKWIEDLSHLTLLCLDDCINFLTLPPLGQLPNLKQLSIKNAHGVVSIESEFLGNGSVAFPKLEYIQIKTMPNWEVWSLVTKQIEHRDVAQEGDAGASRALVLFPRLEKLILDYYPKLIALPEELNQATNLKELRIKEAASLRAVKNLQSISVLDVLECPSLEKVSNLLQLKKLYISNCPNLRCIENVNCLELLYLPDHAMESLPKGLFEIANPQHVADGNAKWIELELFLRCLEGEEDWPIIQ